MISYYIKYSQQEDFQKVSSPRASDVWVVASGVKTDELQKLSENYSLDNNIVRDVLDTNELPRVEFSNDGLYVFLRIPRRTKRGEIVSSPLLAIVRDSVFITASTAELNEPDQIMKTGNGTRASDSVALLLSTLAAAVGSYEEYIKKTARFIKDTGYRLRSHEVTNRDFIHFVTIEDNLNEYQMDLSGMLAVTHRLKDNPHHQLSEADMEAINDIILYIEQLLVSISSYTQSITSIRNAYSTIADNNLNQRMKTLTVLTVLLALPNVFYGMYGMNVPLPFAEESWAYAAIVLFTLSLILIVLLLAKRFRVL